MSLQQEQAALLKEFGSPIGGRKSDQAYGMLKRAILLRHYPPETQILEQTLAGELHCSQSTIREALLNLAKDGLVERRGYQGTVVTATSLAEAASMVEVRLTIERKIAISLSRSGAPATSPRLTAVLEQMDQAHKDQDFYAGSELDRLFHSELAIVAGMPLVSPILQRCALHIHRFTFGGVEVPREFLQEAGIGAEHRALLEELYSGCEVRAEVAIVHHLAHVLDRWAPSLHHAVGPETFAVPA